MKEYNFDENKNMGETVRIDDIKLRRRAKDMMENTMILTSMTTMMIITGMIMMTITMIPLAPLLKSPQGM